MAIKKIIAAAAAVVILAGGAGLGFMRWHNQEMAAQQAETDRQVMNAKTKQEVIDKLNLQVDELKDENGSMKQQIEDLMKQIQDLITVPVVDIDAMKLKDEIIEISEVATIEYQYNNAGWIDEKRKFSFWDHDAPLTQKKCVIAMDGKIKAGIDASKVDIKTNESKKIITVSLPPAYFISNELFEDSISVIVDYDSWFNELTAEDHNKIRKQMKDTAKENAESSGILKMADERVRLLFQNMIEMLPNVKGNYEIEFKTVK